MCVPPKGRAWAEVRLGVLEGSRLAADPLPLELETRRAAEVTDELIEERELTEPARWRGCVGLPGCAPPVT